MAVPACAQHLVWLAVSDRTQSSTTSTLWCFLFFSFLVLLFPLLLPDRFRISTTPSPSHRTNAQPSLREQVALLDCIALFQHGLGLSAAAGQAAGLGSVGGQNWSRRLDFLGARETKVGDSRLFCGEPAVVVGSGWL